MFWGFKPLLGGFYCVLGGLRNVLVVLVVAKVLLGSFMVSMLLPGCC